MQKFSFPAPALVQGADEDALLALGDVVLPGTIKRHPGENGLHIWAEGEVGSEETRGEALAAFQTLLGLLRTWKSIAGMLAEEGRRSIGQGPVRDEAGNQYVLTNSIIDYGPQAPEELMVVGEEARLALARSEHLPTALRLNGRTNRDAADLYMIYECAKREFEGPPGICGALGISERQQEHFTQSANCLSPLTGGRHLPKQGKPRWPLERQADFMQSLLRLWISHLGNDGRA